MSLAIVALATGAGVYMFARDPSHVYLLPSALAFAKKPGIISTAIGGSLPSFLHVYAFSLLTAAVVTSRTIRTAALIAGAWCALDILVELGQLPAIAPSIAASLPAWFRGVPLLDNVGPYLLRGTFDPADVVACVAGAALAVATITCTYRQRSVS